MAPKRSQEKPTDAFEKLRQAFDIIKANHTDPWNWHPYLAEEEKPVENAEDDPDAELNTLKPKVRTNMEKLKSHLLACVSELNRAAAAADMCYFHMCCSPWAMKDCVIILGTAGDIDEEMLARGEVSPQKMLAALQLKLDRANAQVSALESEIAQLKDSLVESRTLMQERFMRWQEAAMTAEEAITRLNSMTVARNEGLEREAKLKVFYYDVLGRLIRAGRLMKYKGRQLLRDRVFNCNKKENMFYSFHGFVEILRTEKEERLRREAEEERNAIEFALRNEVKLLLQEGRQFRGNMEKLAVKVSLLKRDRRALACRLLYKHRPHVPLEYCLWVWELWQPIRKQLALEKFLETEQAGHDAAAAQLVQTSKQLLPLVDRIEQLRIEVVAEKVAHDESRRQLIANSARQLADFCETLQAHRLKELGVLGRLHQIDVEERDERIAVLEREIAEDKHIHALKGMVVDLESNLRKALDRRKQKKFAVLPTGANLCANCSRGITYNGWQDLTKTLAPDVTGGTAKTLTHSMSEADLKLSSRGSPRLDAAGITGSTRTRFWPGSPERAGSPRLDICGVTGSTAGVTGTTRSRFWSGSPEKSGQFQAIWR